MLSNVYGSGLQSPNTLKSYVCASCTTTFQRDSTMTLLGSPTSRCVFVPRYFTFFVLMKQTMESRSSLLLVLPPFLSSSRQCLSVSASSVPASKPMSSRPRPISALTLFVAVTNPLRSIDSPLGTRRECLGCKNGVGMFEPGAVPSLGTTRWHSFVEGQRQSVGARRTWTQIRAVREAG